MGDVALLGVGLAGVLVPGVHDPQHDVRAQGPGLACLGNHGGGIEQVDLPGLLGAQPVEAVCGIDDGDPGRGGLQDQDALRLRLGPVRARVPESGGVEGVQGADESRGAAVNGVVAGRRAGLIAHAPDGGDDLRRNVEGGIPGERSVRARHRGFQMADRHVALLDVAPLALQQRPEVQPRRAGGAGVLAGLLPELGVDQHVPGDQDGGAPDGRTAGTLPGRRRRRRRRRRASASACPAAGAAAGRSPVPPAAAVGLGGRPARRGVRRMPATPRGQRPRQRPASGRAALAVVFPMPLILRWADITTHGGDR